jgi:hypothetical protein
VTVEVDEHVDAVVANPLRGRERFRRTRRGSDRTRARSVPQRRVFPRPMLYAVVYETRPIVPLPDLAEQIGDCVIAKIRRDVSPDAAWTPRPRAGRFAGAGSEKRVHASPRAADPDGDIGIENVARGSRDIRRARCGDRSATVCVQRVETVPRAQMLARERKEGNA